ADPLGGRRPVQERVEHLPGHSERFLVGPKLAIGQALVDRRGWAEGTRRAVRRRARAGVDVPIVLLRDLEGVRALAARPPRDVGLDRVRRLRRLRRVAWVGYDRAGRACGAQADARLVGAVPHNPADERLIARAERNGRGLSHLPGADRRLDRDLCPGGRSALTRRRAVGGKGVAVGVEAHALVPDALPFAPTVELLLRDRGAADGGRIERALAEKVGGPGAIVRGRHASSIPLSLALVTARQAGRTSLRLDFEADRVEAQASGVGSGRHVEPQREAADGPDVRDPLLRDGTERDP